MRSLYEGCKLWMMVPRAEDQVSCGQQTQAWPGPQCSFLWLTGIQSPRMALCYQDWNCIMVTTKSYLLLRIAIYKELKHSSTHLCVFWFNTMLNVVED
jgi:hypothetical protein